MSPSTIRNLLCDYLSQLSIDEKIIVGHFIIGKTFDEYVVNLRKNGTYADHIAVEFTSRMLGQSITVIDCTNDLMIGNSSSDNMLYVGYIASLQHYVSVQPND